MSYGVLAIAKVEEGEGSLIQTVIVKIDDTQRQAHAAPLKSTGEALLGWMYEQNILSRGYLLPEDYPEWMTPEQEQVAISRFKLWAAHYNRVKGDRTQHQPTYPVGVYKHSQQYNYNKGKWGLDKNTEVSENVSIVAKLKFE